MFRRLWSGDRRLDPEGSECRIGALWTLLFLRNKWALTAFGKIWMKNDLTWTLYLADPWWRAHERHHLVQLREQFGGSHWRYLWAFVSQYLRHRSHDAAPLEKEANEAADAYMAAQRQQDV